MHNYKRLSLNLKDYRMIGKKIQWNSVIWHLFHVSSVWCIGVEV